MKKMLTLVLMVACVATVARADFYEYSATLATGAVTTVSDQIPVAGYLDRVEIIQTAGRTNSFTIASYDGTTAIDTVVSSASLATATDVIRPRVIGTTTAGVDLAGAITGGTNTSAAASTVLIAPYERPLVGGNLKVSILGNAANVETTAVKVRFYFERFHR